MLELGNRIRRPHVLVAAHAERVIAAHIERILKNLLVAERLLVQTDGLFHHFEHADSLDLR